MGLANGWSGGPGFTLSDRHSPMAKQKFNWREDNHTLSPIWRNLKFHIRRRFIFRTGVRYKTICILYNDSYTTLSETWRYIAQLHGKLHKMLKRNFYQNFYVCYSKFG